MGILAQTPNHPITSREMHHTILCKPCRSGILIGNLPALVEYAPRLEAGVVEVEVLVTTVERGCRDAGS
jgi:hypothetical protein